MRETPGPSTPSGRAYESLRTAVLHGDFRPGDPLRPQELADARGVSLAVVRECLLRLVGEGLAERLTNRGFVVPQAGDRRWQTIAEARCLVEPAMLRLSVERGDLEWEASVRSAHHRLAGTPAHDHDGDPHPSDGWAAAHHDFHRALLQACANDVLLETFERLWTASELARRWSAARNPSRNYLAEHRRLEELTLRRDPQAATTALTAHLAVTAAVLAPADDAGRRPRSAQSTTRPADS